MPPSITRAKEIPLAKLVPNEWNPNRMSDRTKEAVKESLTSFDQFQELTVRPHPSKKGYYQVLDGYHRWEQLQAIGKEAAFCNVLTGLSDAEAKKITIISNETRGSADEEALAQLLFQLQEEIGLDDLLDGLPYEPSDLDSLFSQFNLNEEEKELNEDEEDVVPEIQEEAISVVGDVWLLGKHRVMCGDSTSIEDVTTLMGDRKADLCVTDPPYGVDYDPEQRASYFSPERKAKPLGKIKSDKGTPEEFFDFLCRAYHAIDFALREGGSIYVFHSDKGSGFFYNAFLRQDWSFSCCLIWQKTVLVFGRSDYHSMHEPVLYGWKNGEAHYFTSDRTQTTLLEFPTPHYDKANNDTDKYVHPTQKPVPLIAKLIENSSLPGNLVVDLFGGSGTTLIASEKLDRTAYLMELDPRFVDAIVRRWQSYTGKEGKLELTGQSFEEVSGSRL